MSILVDTTTVKAYTFITSTTYDDYIDLMRPVVLEDIVEYCNNKFIESTRNVIDDSVSFSSASTAVYITDTSFDVQLNFRSGDPLYVASAKFNKGWFTVDSVTDTSILVNESIVTESSDSGKSIRLFRVDFPDDLPHIASMMINYHIEKRDAKGIKSKGLGDFSITYETVGANQYPSDITGGLKKYKVVRTM